MAVSQIPRLGLGRSWVIRTGMINKHTCAKITLAENSQSGQADASVYKAVYKSAISVKSLESD